jgi:hypothetical protein
MNQQDENGLEFEEFIIQNDRHNKVLYITKSKIKDSAKPKSNFYLIHQ